MASTGKRGAAEWREIISAWRASGQSRAAYCREQGLSVSTFRFWQRKLAEQRAEKPRLVQVKRVSGLEAGKRPIRVRSGGLEVELSGEESEEVLCRLFRALRGE